MVLNLREVADLLRSAGSPKGPPTRVADLAQLRSIYPAGYEAVKSGDIVILWGATIRGEGDERGNDEVVAAYEKSVPTVGGYVLLTNGDVKQMTPDEFKAAPKATTR